MTTKPIIGINADYRAARKDAPAFSYLCEGYYECIIASGGIPIVVPLQQEAADLTKWRASWAALRSVKKPV